MRQGRATGRGSFRIIGGRWRGRRLRFPSDAAIRPTPDRVRETVFNWLSPIIDGARCLDLFAGSGALGVEALSRGARSVTFVDHSPVAVDSIRQHVETLDAEDCAVVIAAEAERHLQRDAATFDIAFIDPPFAMKNLDELLGAVTPRLKPYNRVYLETDPSTPMPDIEGWEVLRDKRAGAVRYRLLTFTRSDDA